MKVNSIRERILELIYGNVPLIPCDPEGPKVIKAHFEQALTLIAETDDKKLTMPEPQKSVRGEKAVFADGVLIVCGRISLPVMHVSVFRDGVNKASQPFVEIEMRYPNSEKNNLVSFYDVTGRQFREAFNEAYGFYESLKSDGKDTQV